jgi:DNA mismatch repair protein MSH6
MAIAGAVLHQLSTHTLPLCCFATHYSSLTDDYKYHPNIRNMHMGTIVDEEERKVCVFFHGTSDMKSNTLTRFHASLFSLTNSRVELQKVLSVPMLQALREYPPLLLNVLMTSLRTSPNNSLPSSKKSVQHHQGFP